MWRPEGWENPYRPLSDYGGSTSKIKGPHISPEEIFEAGADAMLESLIQEINKPQTGIVLPDYLIKGKEKTR